MKTFSALLFFILSLSVARAQTTDSQLWTALQVETEITKHLTLSLSGEVRFDHDISKLRSAFGELEVNWKFNKYFAVSVDYRYGGRNYDDLAEFAKGHRISFFTYGKYKFKKFTISDRLGYFNQYLIDQPEGINNPQKYIRNKTQLKYDITKKLSPLVYFEFFYRLSGKNKEVAENRYAGGAEYDFNKHNSIKLLYIYSTDVNVKPKNKDTRNIISLSYTLKF